MISLDNWKPLRSWPDSRSCRCSPGLRGEDPAAELLNSRCGAAQYFPGEDRQLLLCLIW